MQRIFVQAVLGTLLLGAGMARAVPMEPVEQHSVTVSATLPLDFTDYTVDLLLPQINPAHFASIASIVVTLSGTVEGDYSAYNKRAGGTYYNQVLTIQSTVTVGSPTSSGASNALGVVIPLISTMFNIGPLQTVTGGYDASNTKPDLGIVSSTTTTTTNDPSSTVNFAAIAQSFLGYNNIDIPVVAEGQSSFVGSSNVTYTTDSKTGAAVTVTVNYITVPEPSALALIGSALLGVGLLRRRQKGSLHA